jgi:hypothetical protein
MSREPDVGSGAAELGDELLMAVATLEAEIELVPSNPSRSRCGALLGAAGRQGGGTRLLGRSPEPSACGHGSRHGPRDIKCAGSPVSKASVGPCGMPPCSRSSRSVKC